MLTPEMISSSENTTSLNYTATISMIYKQRMVPTPLLLTSKPAQSLIFDHLLSDSVIHAVIFQKFNKSEEILTPVFKNKDTSNLTIKGE